VSLYTPEWIDLGASYFCPSCHALMDELEPLVAAALKAWGFRPPVVQPDTRKLSVRPSR